MGRTAVSLSARMTGLMLASAALIVGSSANIGLASPQTTAAARVDDFQLSDQNYVGPQLYKMRDAKAVVLIRYAAGDASVRADAAQSGAGRLASVGMHL